jgi:hemolysin activation/secretion protein
MTLACETGALRLILFAGAAILASAGAAVAQDAPPEAQPAAPASEAADPGPGFDIEAFDVDGNTLLKPIEVETAVYPFMGPGRFAADVDKAREALEKAYHAKGFQSVVVEIPPQRADAGVVRLSVLEAPVGRLRVEGARFFSPEMIKRQIPSIVEGKTPNFTAAQAEITDVNRLPDRRVTPVLKAGKVPGTIDIDLKVTETAPIHATVEANNDHAQGTTEERLSTTLRFSNLWQLGHAVSATYLVAPNRKEDSEVIAGSYLAPVWGTPWTVLVFGYNSNSDIASLGGASVLGKGYSVGVRGIYQLPSLGSASQSLTVGFDYKNFDETITLGTPSTDPLEAPIRYVPVTGAYSINQSDDVSSSNLTVSVSAGLRGIGSDSSDYFDKRAYATANFVHLNIEADHTRTLADGTSVFLRLSSQLSDQPLISAEQFSAGGLTTVRGYLQSETVGDNGVFASAELRTPNLSPMLGEWTSKFVDDWRFYTFVDGAQTWVIQPLADQDASSSLVSVGLGARLQLLRYLYGDLLIGLPMSDTLATRADDPRVSFSLKMEF